MNSWEFAYFNKQGLGRNWDLILVMMFAFHCTAKDEKSLVSVSSFEKTHAYAQIFNINNWSYFFYVKQFAFSRLCSPLCVTFETPSKCVTPSRMRTHLKYGVNTSLCGEDEFEIAQTSQNINMTPGPNGIVPFSEEGKRLTGVISINSNCYYCIYWSS